jgi:hypothetical protein
MQASRLDSALAFLFVPSYDRTDARKPLPENLPELVDSRHERDGRGYAALKFVSAVGSGVANQVNALAVSSGGALFAAGNCITAGGELTS